MSINEIQILLDPTKTSSLLCQMDLTPESINDLSPRLRHLPSQRKHEFRETNEISALFIENIEDMVNLSVRDVNSLVLNHLLKLLIGTNFSCMIHAMLKRFFKN